MKPSFPLQVASRSSIARRGCFILMTGGTRSGKSRFAVALAKRWGRRVFYVATCHAADREMRQRIARHQRQRPKHWHTIEPPADPLATLLRLDGKADGLILDCLTMYVSDLMVAGHSDAAVQRKVRQLCRLAHRVSYPVAMVTNEVGSSVVPDHALGRRFCDLAGLANQIAAGFADQVFLLVAGLPLQLKGNQTLAITYPAHGRGMLFKNHALRLHAYPAPPGEPGASCGCAHKFCFAKFINPTLSSLRNETAGNHPVVWRGGGMCPSPPKVGSDEVRIFSGGATGLPVGHLHRFCWIRAFQ